MKSSRVVSSEVNKLKSDYFRIEIIALHSGSFQLVLLKSDYFRIEIILGLCLRHIIPLLKSDYFRIEIWHLHQLLVKL